MKRVYNFLKRYWITITIFIGLFILYKFIADNGVLNPYLFPSTNKIIQSFRENWQTMVLNMFASFGLLLPSLFISTIIALSVGIILGINKTARRVLQPVAETFSVIPSILLSPFALLMAPSFKSASIFMIIYSAIWPTLFATITGITTIDKRYLDTAETLELTGIKKVTKVIIPAVLPSIISGFNTSLRGSFIILVFAEMYGAQYGMGYFVKRYADLGIYEHVWSGFIFLVVVLVITMRIYEVIKDRLLKWTMD